jgi:hypothetical protein
VTWDEVKYEGSIDFVSGWGSLSGQEMADRFWWGLSLGVHVGHSETVLRANTTGRLQGRLMGRLRGRLVGRLMGRLLAAPCDSAKATGGPPEFG